MNEKIGGWHIDSWYGKMKSVACDLLRYQFMASPIIFFSFQYQFMASPIILSE